MSAVPIITTGSSGDDSSSGAPTWAIYLAGTSTQAITPDTFVDLNPRGEARVSDYPVEHGAFASYNKVQVPREVRVSLACGGEQMTREDFLEQLKSMRQSITLYDIATPDELFENFTLVRTDYSRRARRGVSLVVVECVFEEVRQTAQASYSSSAANGTPQVDSNSPSANDPIGAGQVSPVSPQPAQSAAIFGAGIL